MHKFFQTTKKNYEVADLWHQEKSRGYDWKHEMERFAEMLPKEAKVLDIGSGGSGRDIQTFRDLGFHVDALDYSGPAIMSLRGKFPDIQIYEADLRKTGLRADTYDGIWACASILNVPKSDVPTALSEFARLLKKGGVLFVSVKRGEGEGMVPDKAGERFFSFFSEPELRDTIRRAGFKVRDVESVHESVFTGNEDTEAVWVCAYAVK